MWIAGLYVDCIWIISTEYDSRRSKSLEFSDLVVTEWIKSKNFKERDLIKIVGKNLKLVSN